MQFHISKRFFHTQTNTIIRHQKRKEKEKKNATLKRQIMLLYSQFVFLLKNKVISLVSSFDLYRISTVHMIDTFFFNVASTIEYNQFEK